MTRIGLLGGTFDPVHNGHLALARAALDCCGLDQVRFMPAALQPFKQAGARANYDHRARMIELAVAPEPSFVLSTVESALPTPSYTIDTLDHLRAQGGADEEFYFIIGADAFLEIANWKGWQRLINELHWIVCPRDPVSGEQLQQLVASLGFVQQAGELLAPDGRHRLVLPKVRLPEISSSQLRDMLAQKPEAARGLLPDPVWEYIRNQGLYGQGGGG